MPDPAYAFYFFFEGGAQSNSHKTLATRNVWAVQTGDIGTAISNIPTPAAWLFGSGLLGLIGFARRKAS